MGNPSPLDKLQERATRRAAAGTVHAIDIFFMLALLKNYCTNFFGAQSESRFLWNKTLWAEDEEGDEKNAE